MTRSSARPRSTRRVNTPTVLQMETMECGAAALGIILGYYRRFVPLTELRRICGVSRDGVLASQITHAAEHYGLRPKAQKLDAVQALSQRPPFIAYWNNNHFVVVEGHSRGKVYLNDPASGRKTISLKEFEESFSEVALKFEPGPDFKKGGHRSTIIPSLMEWSKGSRQAIFLVGAISLLLVVPTLFMSATLKVFIDEILAEKFDTWLFPLLVGLALAGVANALLTWFQQSVLLRLQIKFAASIATNLIWHMLKLPILFFTQRYYGDLISRLQSANFIANLLSSSLPTAVVSAISATAYAVIMGIFNLQLTLVALFLTLLNLLVVIRVQRRIRDLNASLLNTSAKITGAAMAGLRSISTLKATGAEGDFFGIWSGYQTNAINASQRLNRISTYLMAVPALLSSMTTAAVLGFGAVEIMAGNMSIGGLVAFQLLLSNFSGPVNHLMAFNDQMQTAVGHVNRLNDVFHCPTDPILEAQTKNEPAFQSSSARKDSANPKGQIELRNVSFRFVPTGPNVIENISLKIEAGQRIGLVGPSGSGKSTLLRLILGLYQPTEGEVLYDGRPITEFDRRSFAAAIGWVDKGSDLFEGSILDNLTLWDDAVPGATVIKGAKDACIHTTIMQRVGGYSAQVDEGGQNFSGGQQQRLEIARVLAQQPSILVLDEATSALDSQTEAEIIRNIQRRGVTSLMVAHRLSTIRDCETIYVLKDGHIIEAGGHRALMRKKGFYAELVWS